MALPSPRSETEGRPNLESIQTSLTDAQRVQSSRSTSLCYLEALGQKAAQAARNRSSSLAGSIDSSFVCCSFFTLLILFASCPGVFLGCSSFGSFLVSFILCSPS
mmetsp:Transcript_35710/g.77143  ORF Transcript_35710/g.77143 Transcript_35710/m.77143 type:complete len:105 (-) Transcript_35710:153-467(-)